MFSITHESREASVYISETEIYAVYEDDHDVFYHVEIGDESVDLESDLISEFGKGIANRILLEI